MRKNRRKRKSNLLYYEKLVTPFYLTKENLNIKFEKQRFKRRKMEEVEITIQYLEDLNIFDPNKYSKV